MADECGICIFKFKAGMPYIVALFIDGKNVTAKLNFGKLLPDALVAAGHKHKIDILIF